MNNSFLQSVCDVCGLEIATVAQSYKYSVFGGHTFALEGHKGLVDYLDTALSFAVCGGILRVMGQNLRIKCLDKRFAVVCGNINAVEVVRNG